MKNENVKKYTIIGLISLLVIAVIGVAYAYFGLEVEGTGKDIVMDTGDLRLEYMDDQELSLVGATPGDSVSKTITVKNVGTRNVAYTLYWGDLINTIENFELHITMECKSYKNYGTDTQEESGTCDRIYRAVPMSDTVTSGTIKNNISIDVGITHVYNITVSFDNKTYEQNNNKNKKFTGKIGIEEYKANDCIFDGELTSGVEYVNGQYTYAYQRKYDGDSDGWSFTNSSSEGWGVKLTDKTSTDPITTKICNSINGKPILYMTDLFKGSSAVSIDVSSFDTSNVFMMYGMFANSSATELIGVEVFDTSNISRLKDMFYNSKALAINASSFDTSNVFDMYNMFSNSKANSIDVSSFDTSNVTDMRYMFNRSNVGKLDISNFNTSNITDMDSMFRDSKMTFLDLSSFDTSKVTSMGWMFAGANIKKINLNNFDTSKVTDMGNMFRESKCEVIDLSGFNTSNLTSMSQMFFLSTVSEIKGLESFDTTKITDMHQLFYKNNVTTLDLSSFDTSNVTNMSGMFQSMRNLTTIYASDKFNVNNVTKSENMFWASNKIVGGAGTVFDSNNIDKTYARVDGGTEAPGYFTLKSN